MAGGAIYARTSSQVRNNMDIRYTYFNKNEAFKKSDLLFDDNEIKIPGVSSLSVLSNNLILINI